MVTAIFSTLPGAFWVISVVVIVFGLLIGYALRTKGDVSAEFFHGATSFRLEAKDRKHRK